MEFADCHYTRMYRGFSQFYCLDMALFLDIVRVTETRRLPFFSKRKKQCDALSDLVSKTYGGVLLLVKLQAKCLQLY